MSDKYNLIDFGNISEPAAGVVNNFVNKISSALQWMLSPKDIKPSIMKWYLYPPFEMGVANLESRTEV